MTINRTNKRATEINEWILAIYLLETNVCSIISSFVSIPYLSVVLMIALVVVQIIVHGQRVTIDKRLLVLFFIVLFTFFVSIIFNGYQYIVDYFIFFLVFGGTAIIISSNLVDLSEVIKKIIFISFISITVYFVFSRNNFISADNYWSKQMGIAYSYVTTAVFSMAYLFFRSILHRDKSKKMLILSIINLIGSMYIILFDCGTRGAIVAVVASLVLMMFCAVRGFKQTIIVLLSFIITIVFFMQFGRFQNWIFRFFQNGSIRALSKYAFMIGNNSEDNGRLRLYKDALIAFKNSPIFGNGIGYFEIKHDGGYVHQLFLQILCEYGIIGLFIFVLPIINKYIYVYRQPIGETKIFSVILLGITIPGLLFSSTYWLQPNFWFFVVFILLIKNKIEEEKIWLT